MGSDFVYIDLVVGQHHTDRSLGRTHCVSSLATIEHIDDIKADLQQAFDTDTQIVQSPIYASGNLRDYLL